jgi:hypothetical protein
MFEFLFIYSSPLDVYGCVFLSVSLADDFCVATYFLSTVSDNWDFPVSFGVARDYPVLFAVAGVVALLLFYGCLLL